MQERNIIFYKNYFINFYSKLTSAVQEKFDYVLLMLQTVDKVPGKFLKHIENETGLYEIRVEYGSNIYRVFCCFDKGNIVVLFNGFQKKSRKTPKRELEIAIKLKKEYFNTK